MTRFLFAEPCAHYPFHDQKLAAACRVRLTQGYARLEPALSSPNHRLAPLGYRPKRLPCSGLHDECTTLPRSILPSLGTRNAVMQD
jgi:hypothetical protein